MTLSHDIRESIKTALAMTLVYGIGLQMGWDKPYWAGFAVAFISLATVGQSFNKGALRMVGTVMGAVVALTLIALFAQQRWLFILFLSLWFGLCTYMMAGSRYQYFWFVGGFVSLIIGVDGGPDAGNAFAIAMLRLQQTGLGIGVYSLVSILLWPKSSRADLDKTVLSQVATQQKLFHGALQLLVRAGDGAVVKSLRAEETAGVTRLATLLDAATTDSEDVRQLENEWRVFQRASAELAETMQRWRENFSELQSMPLGQLLPGLDAFALELDHRFTGITSMLGHEAAQQPCTDITLAIDSTAGRAQSHFNRAALLVAQRHMLHIEELTRTLFDSSSRIGGFTDSPVDTLQAAGKPAPWVPDPERLQAAGKIMVVLWLAFLAVIYIGDFPAGFGFVSMCGPIGMMLVTNPQMPVRLLFTPVATSIAFAGALYIFVMPQLSSFTGLGLMIFLATFLICYRYASPQQGLGRAVGLALFVVIISVSNQQSYSFLSVATTALMFVLLFLLMAIVAYIPYSPRPERVLLRLLTRYFRSAGFLLSQAAVREKEALASWREDFHRQELASLPAKLNVWLPHADPTVLGAESVQQLPALAGSLQTLTYRLEELLEVRGLPQSPTLVTALRDDMQRWHQQVIDAFRHLYADKSYKRTLLRGRMEERLAQLERHIETHLDGTGGDGLSPTDQENIYRLLSAYRGASLALLDFVNVTANVDWTPWYEERFA
jgi:uncharacterized membrane protein YccC